MRRWVVIALLCSAPVAARGQNYIVQAEVWAVCGQVSAQVDGNFWTLQGTWDAPYYTSMLASFSGDMSAKTVYMTPLLGGCCDAANPECSAPATGSIWGSDGYYYSTYIIGPWECHLNYSELVNPTVTEQACDHLRLTGPSGVGVEWQVSSTGADPWYTISDSYVTASTITGAAPLDPYAQLFARYIPVGRHTAGPGGYLSFPPSASVPFRLYHAAPALTLTPTNQLCETVSGITVSAATLPLPQVKVSIRRDNNGVWETVLFDTDYSSSTFAGTFFALSPGKYEMAARNWGGAATDVCPAIFPFEITGTYPAVTITPSVTHETCYGPAATGSISLTVGGPGTTAPYTYAWTHGPTTQNLSGLAGDQGYSVTVRDVNGCSGTSSNIRVEEPDAIARTSAYVLTDVSCHVNTLGTHNDGVIRIEASGGTGALQYRVAGASHSTSYPGAADIGGLYADSYTVYVRDANLCEVSFSSPVPLTGPSDITYTSVNKEDVACAGTLSGSIEIIGAAGGAASFQYALDGGTYQPAPLFEHLASGGHTVWIRDAKSCRKDVSVTLAESAAITFGTINVQPQSCVAVQDGSIAITATGTGSLTYALEDVPTSYQASGTFTGLAAGNYSIYVKDGNGCGASTSGTVVGVKAAIAGNITVSQVISCRGVKDGALNLTVTGGGTAPYNYLWTDNNTTTEDRTGLGAALYSVVITDSKTCQQTLNYNLTEPGALILGTTVSNYNNFGVRCAGGNDGTINLQVTGGTAPYGYTWTSGQLTEDLSNLPAGNYGVTVLDSHGCSASLAGISLTAPSPLTANVPQATNILCNYLQNGQVAASGSGGAGAYQYALNGGAWQSSPLFTGLDAGLYTVQLRDGNGCLSGPQSATVTKPSALVITKALDEQTQCGQANGALGVSVTGGAGAYQYAWYRVGEGVVIATTPSVTGLRSADYRIVIEDGNQCSADATYSINTSDGPQVTQTLLRGLTCHASNDGAISVSIAGGQTPYTITWDIAGATGTSVTNVTGGDHWIEVLDGRGCRTKVTYPVSAPPALQLSKTVTAPLCTGASNGRIVVQASGGNTGGYTYAWNTTETTATIENLQAGQYSVVVKDSKQCSLSETITVTDPAEYTVDAGGDRTICLGQRLTVQAPEGAVTYLWTSDAGFESSGREVVLTVPARYTLKVINANGCEAEDQFTLGTADNLLTADFLMASEAHVGDTVVLVDISWPLPDNIGWTFPQGVQLLSKDDAYATVIFPVEGEYEVVLDTHLGECMDYLAKRITIQGERDSEGGRVSTGLVSRFDVYPNPNDGAFTIAIAFREAVDGSLKMIDLSGNATVLDEKMTAGLEYSFQAALQQIPSGIYVLMLQVNGSTYSKRIMVE